MYPSIRIERLGPKANISSTVLTSSLLFILISKISKLIPSPDNRSAIPPKSANVNNFANAGALITLKFSIVILDTESMSSNTKV